MKEKASLVIFLSLVLTACGQEKPPNLSDPSTSAQPTQNKQIQAAPKPGELNGTYQCYYKGLPITWWEFKPDNILVIHSANDVNVKDINGNFVEHVEKNYRISADDFLLFNQPPVPDKHFTLSHGGKKISSTTQDMHCDKEEIKLR